MAPAGPADGSGPGEGSGGTGGAGSNTGADPEGVAPDALPPILAPQNVVGAFLGAAADQIGRVIKPEAAAVVAVAFGFPLGLSLAVLLFLAVQGRLDARDPKLRLAPKTRDDGLIAFKEEGQL